ncbi:MAG: endolytic transglycosylase MltG, partial [Peptoniphilus harei]
MDSLYLNSISTRDIKIGIVDEVKKTYGEILVATGLREEKAVKPVVLMDEDKKDEEDENVNTFTVPEGTNLDSLGELLISKGLIADMVTYKDLAEDMQIGDKIVPGAYEFDKDMKVKEILAEIAGIELKTYKLNIAEGEGPAQVGKKLLDLGAIESDKAFVEECNRLGVSSFQPGDHEFTMPSKVENVI